MYTILVIDKTGSIKQSRVTSIEDNEMYKKAAKKDYWTEIDDLITIDEVYADIINV